MIGYTNVHLADVLKLPGVKAAQAFHYKRRGSTDRVLTRMAIWPSMKIDIDDLNVTLAKLREVSGTEQMPLSAALQDERLVWIYEPVTERVHRD